VLYIDPFLGPFAQLRKGTVGFVTSVGLSVCIEELGCHWADFYDV